MDEDELRLLRHTLEAGTYRAIPGGRVDAERWASDLRKLLALVDAARDGSHLGNVLERLSRLRSRCLQGQWSAERRAKELRGEHRWRLLGQARTLAWVAEQLDAVASVPEPADDSDTS